MECAAKTIVLIVCIAAAALLAAAIFAANYLVSFALDCKSSAGMAAEEIAEEKLSEWERLTQGAQAVSVQAADGLALNALLVFPQRSASADGAEGGHRYVISVHGYKSLPASMVRLVAHYIDAGWNVLAIEQRAHGASSWRYTGMGYFEKDDLIRWINYIEEIDSSAKIALHGVSMGAATVMLATGEELPPSVVAAVEDCGYSTLNGEFAAQLKALFSLPPFPLLPLASLVCKMRAGYFFSGVDCISAVARSKTPTLFIHGEADAFVPFSMLDDLYEAAACKKQKLAVPGAAHAESEETDSALYWGAVDEFLLAELGALEKSK